MMPRINQITLQHFRGATGETVVNLDATKPLTLLFGANGTGKTTLIDAIDAVCNDSGGSIDDRSGATVGEHMVSFGGNDGNLQATLRMGTSVWTAHLGGHGNGHFIGVDRATAPNAHILRRSKLTKLTEATPGNRFNSLKAMIDIGAVQDAETGLNAALKAAIGVCTNTRTKLNAQIGALNTLWVGQSSPGAPQGTSRTWANHLQGPGDNDQARLSALNVLLGSYKTAQSKRNAYMEAQRNVVQAEEAVRQTEEAVRQTQIRVDDAIALMDRDGAGIVPLIELLEKAQKYVAPPANYKLCPVCGQEKDTALLYQRIVKELEPLKELRQLITQLDKAQRILADARVILGRERVIAERECVSVLAEGRNLLQVVDASNEPRITQLINQPHVEWAMAYTPLRDGANEDGVFDLVRDLLLAVEHVHADLETIQKRLNAEAILRSAVQAVLQQINELEAALVEAEMVRRALKRTCDIVSRERRQFLDEMFEAVVGYCNRIYTRIHPEENLGLSRAEMRRVAGGSLNWQGTFGTSNGIPPQAYFSESHLDTLGVCFWLALARHLSGANGIIVLDDVFQSVDASHRDRILTVLTEEAQNFRQVIVSTHFEHWRDAAAALPQVGVVQLQEWKREMGVQAVVA